jgi:hypothetical protein
MTKFPEKWSESLRKKGSRKWVSSIASGRNLYIGIGTLIIVHFKLLLVRREKTYRCTPTPTTQHLVDVGGHALTHTEILFRSPKIMCRSWSIF